MSNLDLLRQPYDREQWKVFIRALFPAQADLFAVAYPLTADNEWVQSFVQFGNIQPTRNHYF
jgi:hypothetical protein